MDCYYDVDQTLLCSSITDYRSVERNRGKQCLNNPRLSLFQGWKGTSSQESDWAVWESIPQYWDDAASDLIFRKALCKKYRDMYLGFASMLLASPNTMGCERLTSNQQAGFHTDCQYINHVFAVHQNNR